MFNTVILAGKVVSNPIKEETFGAVSIYSFKLAVLKSCYTDFDNPDECDIFTVRISDQFDSFNRIKIKSYIRVCGSLRSYFPFNAQLGTKIAEVTILCSSLEILDSLSYEDSVCNVKIGGTISSDPSLRKLATGRLMCEFSCRHLRGREKVKSTNFTVVSYGDLATSVKGFQKGDTISVFGHLRIRTYVKHIAKTETDVPIEVVELVAEGIEKTANKQPTGTSSIVKASE